MVRDFAKMGLREEIIEAAIELLSQKGYAKFSALQVARKVGITQSHLTHYFPTRDDLLNEMAAEITKRYIEMIEQWCHAAAFDHEKAIGDFIDLAIDDAVSEPTRTLFPALWEAANNNEEMARALEEIYDRNQANFLRMFKIDPDHSASRALWRLVQLLGVIVEGSTALYGRDQSSQERVQDLKATAKQLMIPPFREAIEQYHRQTG